jgi:hypothetical protein
VILTHLVNNKASTSIGGGHVLLACELPRMTRWGKGAANRLLSSLRSAAGQPLLGWLLGLKLVYLSLVAFTAWGWGDYDEAALKAIDAQWFDQNGGGWSLAKNVAPLARHFATWDSEHYLYLSQDGYGAGVKSCAFYPLWPLIVRWTAPLAGGNHLIGGLVVSNLCSLAAWVLFYERVRRRWGASAAGWALLLLVLFPGSLFFQFLYSESLFILLVMLLWWGLEERRWGLAWVAASLLPLTRAVGLFAVLPIAWQALQVAPPVWLVRLRAKRHTRKPMQDLPTPPPDGTQDGRAIAKPCRWWLLLAGPLAGWAAYLVLMAHWTGNPLEGIEAQKHWGVHSVSNLWNLPKFIVGFFTPTEWHAFRGSLLDRSSLVLLLYSLPVAWRLDKDLMVWIYVLGILPAMSGTFTSYTRFASCAFPMFIALGVFLGRPERRFLRWATVWVFATLHAVLLWRFVNFRWAG